MTFLSLGIRDFSAATLRSQIESPHSQENGVPQQLLQLLLAYSEMLERELISALGDFYVEAGIGGIRADIWIDRRFVRIREEAAARAGLA